MLRGRVALGAVHLLIYGCASFSGTPPHVVERPITAPIPQSRGDLAWSVTNLLPSESTILVDGTRQEISVNVSVKDLRLDGAKYDVGLRATDHDLRPFEIRTTSSESGDLDFSGTLTWAVDISGKSETVTISLYQMRASASGKTIETTLLNRISRTYGVICNRREWSPKRKLKQLFGRCVEQVAVAGE